MAMSVNGVPNDKSQALFGPVCFQRGFERDENGETKRNPDGNPVKKLLVFWAQPLWDYDDFNARCPMPQPEGSAIKFTADKGKIVDYNDPHYLEQMRAHAQKKWGYLVLKTLEPSNIKFESVSLDDPKTWLNVREALTEELAYYERAAVLRLVDEANALDKEKLEENLQNFFHQQKLEPVGASGPLGENTEASNS